LVSFSPHSDGPRVLPVIALTGCDGSGKSTLASALVSHLGENASAEQLYLGQSSGKIGDWIRDLPLIGPSVGRYLGRKSDRVHDRPSEPPGAVTALAIYLLSRWRAHKYRRMLAMCRRGALVITDRYPQAEINGFRYDGPGLGERSDHWLVRKLAAREKRLYERMARYRPALVIKLDIDLPTAHSRKPDHDPAELRDKIAVMSRLTYNGAPLFELDTRAPYADVLRKASLAVIAAMPSLPSLANGIA